MSNPRFMIAAPSSGSGKTMITCGILEALKLRGKKVCAFKCGPDYIDPMFHEKVLHTKSRNLDPFFSDGQMIRYLLAEGARGMEVSVLEGVMGYFDGLGGTSVRASACELAEMTETPVLLVVNTKGMSLSVLALIRGFLEYQKPNRIQGVILNQMSAMLFPRIKKAVEEELGIPVYGYVPQMKDLNLQSRHLGLVLPDEAPGLEQNMQKLANTMEETLDLDGILGLAETAPELAQQIPDQLCKVLNSREVKYCRRKNPVIAIARDEAFCFLYEDNLKLLKELGAKLTFFSPLNDREVPGEASGILLCGGYPELHADRLEGNQSMREDIKKKIEEGMPCMAECGGFLYLHESLEDMDGRAYEMAGMIRGKAYRTGKLGRFGYITLESRTDGILGCDCGPIPAHEFHYFDSTSCGEDFLARKPAGNRSWSCIHGSSHSMMGFPHLYYHANPGLALAFLNACLQYGGEER